MQVRGFMKKWVGYFCVMVGLFLFLSPLPAQADISFLPTSPLTLAVGQSVVVAVSGFNLGQRLTDSKTGGDPAIATLFFAAPAVTSFTVTGVAPGTTTYTLNTTDGITPTFTIIVTAASPRSGSNLPEVRPGPVYQQARIGNCKISTPVHERADADSPVIGQAYLGEIVHLLSWNNGETWCKVFYNGGNNTGWVQVKYIVP